MADLQEIAGLDRVLTRLALTEDDRLEQASRRCRRWGGQGLPGAARLPPPAAALPLTAPFGFWVCLQVLSKLLPIVIGKLGAGASPALQKKVLDILSHTNKRTRALPSLRLPLHELAAVYTGGQAGCVAGLGSIALHWQTGCIMQGCAVLRWCSACPCSTQLLLNRNFGCWLLPPLVLPLLLPLLPS